MLLMWSCESEAGAEAPMSVLHSEDNFKITAGTMEVEGLRKMLVLEMESMKGWKVSHEAPLLIEVVVPDGVKPAKNKYRNADMKVPKAEKPRFEIELTAAAGGKQEITLKFDVVLCTEKMCQKKRFEKTYPLTF
jgi:hypothetical protein